MFKHRKAQNAALKARGIKPGKVTKANPYGQASGGWSPFGAAPAYKPVVDDVEYDFFDRARGGWFKHKPKR